MGEGTGQSNGKGCKFVCGAATRVRGIGRGKCAVEGGVKWPNKAGRGGVNNRSRCRVDTAVAGQQKCGVSPMIDDGVSGGNRRRAISLALRVLRTPSLCVARRLQKELEGRLVSLIMLRPNTCRATLSLDDSDMRWTAV